LRPMRSGIRTRQRKLKDGKYGRHKLVLKGGRQCVH
jgi:hypothetical protein